MSYDWDTTIADVSKMRAVGRNRADTLTSDPEKTVGGSNTLVVTYRFVQPSIAANAKV